MVTKNEPVIWTAGNLRQYDVIRVEPAADDDVLEAVQAWVEAGAPRGGCQAALLLKAIESAGLYRERCIIAAEEKASVMRKTEYQIESIEKFG